MKQNLSDIIEAFIPGDWGNDVFSEETPNDVRCIRGADLENVNKNLKNNIPCRFISNSSLKSRILEVGDIIIEKSGGSPTQSTGRTAYLSKDLLESIGDTVCSNFCVGFRVIPGVNSRYISYYLELVYKSGVFFNFEGKTTGIKNLLLDIAFSSISIPTFNLSEQKNIINILTPIDDKIILNNHINAELEAMAKTFYDYWFVQFDFPDENGKPYKSSGGKMVWNEEMKRQIPGGWEAVKMKDWILVDKSGDWGKEEHGGNFTKKVTCIRGADIKGLNGLAELKPPVRYILEKNSSKILNSHDLIIEISGGSPIQSTGRIAFITDATVRRFENPLICSNFCKTITIKNKKLLYNFVYYWNSLYDAGIFFGYEGKTSGIKNLLFDSFVSSFYTVVPDDKIADQFYNIMENIQEKKQNALAENQKLAELRDWLLPMLMNGQVKVGEAIEQILNIAAEHVQRYKKGKSGKVK